jgi:hypothetical protein
LRRASDHLIAPFPVRRNTEREDEGGFAFLEPWTYLVICNVKGHFMDGMYAWIIVS